jgi:acetyl-CoA C-acetyltransferase
VARPVIVAGARTPIGKMHGSLAPQPAAALAGLAIRAVLERAGVSGAQSTR